MSIGDIIKSTIVRRLVLVALAFLLGYFGIGHAQARTPGSVPACTVKATTTCHTKDEAIAVAQLPATATYQCVGSAGHTDAWGGALWNAEYVSNTVFNENSATDAYILATYRDRAPNNATVGCTALHVYWKPKVCDPVAPELGGGYMKYSGSEPGYQTCVDGCTFNPSSMTFKTGTVDGISYVSLIGWIPSGASCTVGPNDGYVPPQDTDHDGKSDGNDNSPNNPGVGNGGGEDESPKGPGSGPGGGQGNGPGEGSGNGNTSGGGGSCGSPPSSSGDAILGQIAYQAWATRCAIEGAKDGDGNLKTSGSGTGTGTGTGGTGTDPNTAILTAIKEAVTNIKEFVTGISGEAGGLDDSQGEDDHESDHIWAEDQDPPDLDSSGLGFGRSCPQIPNITVGGFTGAVDGGQLCSMMQAIGALMLLIAYFHAATIIGR